MSEKFNDLKVGDRVSSQGFLSAFPKTGVVLNLFEQIGHQYAVYEDGNGWKWRAHADQLTKVSGE